MEDIREIRATVFNACRETPAYENLRRAKVRGSDQNMECHVGIPDGLSQLGRGRRLTRRALQGHFHEHVQEMLPVWHEQLMQTCSHRMEVMEKEKHDLHRRRQLALQVDARSGQAVGSMPVLDSPLCCCRHIPLSSGV
jgi:hypothetical protein